MPPVRKQHLNLNLEHFYSLLWGGQKNGLGRGVGGSQGLSTLKTGWKRVHNWATVSTPSNKRGGRCQDLEFVLWGYGYFYTVCILILIPFLSSLLFGKVHLRSTHLSGTKESSFCSKPYSWGLGRCRDGKGIPGKRIQRNSPFPPGCFPSRVLSHYNMEGSGSGFNNMWRKIPLTIPHCKWLLKARPSQSGGQKCYSLMKI